MQGERERTLVSSPAFPMDTFCAYAVKTHMCKTCIIGKGLVTNSAGFSIPNGIFLVKSPHKVSSACCARAIGIAHEPVWYL